MTFIEFRFLIFLVLAVIAFYICPVKQRWLVLLGSSIVFYAIAGVKYLPFIFVTSFSVYLAGRQMGLIYAAMEEEVSQGDYDRKKKKERKDQAKAKCKKILIGLLILNIGILAVTKYTKFFVSPINDLLVSLGRDGNFTAASIIVPLGISYYTFSSLSYLLDVYWRRVDYENNYARFLLYAIYFPHILQGPIERYGRLGQRLKGEFRFDYHRVTRGIQLIVWGFFKKLVIADRLDIFISGVYEGYEIAGGSIFALALILDVVYIYADFSGCMDIARGVSQIFGVELDLNFNHPFTSKSITEFWRRWHMSLGSWFKDYVYYPVSTSKLIKNLSKSCKKKGYPEALTRSIVTVIPVSITWVLTGLWHGSGIDYLCWGIYYAFWIFMSVTFGDALHAFAQNKLHINTETWAWKIFQMARTTLIFAGGRWLTRPGSLKMSMHAVYKMLYHPAPWMLTDGKLYKFGLDVKGFQVVVISIVIFGIVSFLQQRGSVREMIGKQNLVFRWTFYLVAVFAILILGIYGPGYDAAAFVYMAY